MQEIRMLPYNHIVPPTTSLEKLHTNKLKVEMYQVQPRRTLYYSSLTLHFQQILESYSLVLYVDMLLENNS